MAFTDPQTLTIATIDRLLAKVNQDNFSSEYRLRQTNSELTLRINNSSGSISGPKQSGDTHTVKLTRRQFATAEAPEMYYTFWVTFQVPAGGDTTTVEEHLLGLLGFFNSASIAKLVNSES